QIQILAARRARPDEHGVEPRPEQRLQALHRRAVADVGAHVDDHGDLFVEHGGREPEAGDVRPHQTARPRVLLEDHHFVAERQQIVGHRQRRRTGADAGHALAVLLGRRLGQAIADVTLEVGGHPLDAADGDRLLLDARAAAGRLARTIAGAPQDPGEHVRFAIEDVGVVVASLRHHPDVLRHVGVGRAGPLAVDDFVKVVGVAYVCGLHSDELTSSEEEEKTGDRRAFAAGPDLRLWGRERKRGPSRTMLPRAVWRAISARPASSLGRLGAGPDPLAPGAIRAQASAPSTPTGQGTKENKPWLCISAAWPRTSSKTRPREGSNFTNSWVTNGGSFSPTRLTSRRFARPSSAASPS